MCKKQTCVSHSSTESENISLDVGLRMDGLCLLSNFGTWWLKCYVRQTTLQDMVKRPKETWAGQETIPSKETKRKPQLKRESERLSNCQMWTTYPQTHSLLRVSLSCTFLKTTSLSSRWLSVNSTPHTSHFLVFAHWMTRTSVAQVVSVACALHIPWVISMRSCCAFDSLRLLHFPLFAIYLLSYRPVFLPGHPLNLPRCGGQIPCALQLMRTLTPLPSTTLSHYSKDEVQQWDTCLQHTELRVISCSTELTWNQRSISNMLTPKTNLLTNQREFLAWRLELSS